MSIFVSIAAYRDPELVPTIRDCISKARYSNDLRFGICWQHGEGETVPLDFADQRVRLIGVPWRDSRGACWARAEIMRLWNGEDFFLQLDSHHRFVQDWDAKLLAYAAQSGSARPILSSYPAAYDPHAGTLGAEEPMRMDFHQFMEDGIPMLRPHVIPDWARLGRPLRARFVAAGFLFAPGSFVNDVPYDPELYFIGEEITLAIRAFSHGYDLFHPPEHVLWHQYTRSDRRKHWDDHVQAHGVDLEWPARDRASREKVSRFLTDPHVGTFGCGTARSFAEYEAYTGLSFSYRAAQDATLLGMEPPNPPAPPNWAADVRTWSLRIVLDRAAIRGDALASPRLWYVGFHDAGNVEIFREDANGDELRHIVEGDGSPIVIERRFQSGRRPVTWTVWPMGGEGEWLMKMEGPVDGNTNSR